VSVIGAQTTLATEARFLADAETEVRCDLRCVVGSSGVVSATARTYRREHCLFRSSISTGLCGLGGDCRHIRKSCSKQSG